jgi:hypothetical protein
MSKINFIHEKKNDIERENRCEHVYVKGTGRNIQKGDRKSYLEIVIVL